MKICITSDGNTLDSSVDPRFGRCGYFIFADSDSSQFEAIINPNTNSSGGAGIQSAQLVSSKGAKVVITGNVGPNAFQTLQAAGIKIFTGASGSVSLVVEKYKKGEFKVVQTASVPSKSGMGCKNK